MQSDSAVLLLPDAASNVTAFESAAVVDVDSVDFRQMVEQLDIGVCITQDGCFAYVNAKFAEMHGYAVRDLLQRELMTVVAPEARDRVRRVRQMRDQRLHRSAYVSRNLRRDGTAFDTRIFGRPVTYRGAPANLVTISDISELSDANRLSEWRARMLVSNELLCRSGSIEIDLAAGAVRLSAGALALIGCDADRNARHATDSTETNGRMNLRVALRRLSSEDRREALGQWRRARPGKPFEFRHHLRGVDGRALYVLHRGVVEAVETEGDAVGPMRPVAILQDITEQSAAQAQIDRLLNFDPATGLRTRALLLKVADAAMARVRDGGRPSAMLYLRVPEIKRVHDLLGTRVGELLAAALAGVMARQLRPDDTAARIGGAEFAVLLDANAGADETQASQVAHRILSALAAPIVIDEHELFVDAHIGISMSPGDAATADELVEHARTACGRGDDRLGFFTREVGAHATRRIRMETALRRAFERNELTLRYQPQVDLRDGAVVGVEALLRWKSEEFGDVSPQEFVGIAEEIGLIVAIGEWVFRTACEQTVAWLREGIQPPRTSVNLSPRQLDQADLSQRLQTVLLETGADPAHIGIEVTESVLMRDIERARRTLTELSAIGIEIALDDFGTGYSNLSVLRALPFDLLKIDRSLVHDVTASPEDVSITRAVLMLAQGLKIKVLAEGVETEGQLNLLVGNGCHMVQGYIFSEALTSEAMGRMLLDGRRLPERFLMRTARQRTLLLVDDEENILSALRRLLRADGYRIIVARSGQEGLQALAEQEIDVIVSDQRMPGMTGVEFLRRAKELYPDTIRMALSGYTELQSITDAINEGAIYKFLTKPWDDTQLRGHIAEAFKRKELADENQRLGSEVRNANIELAQANERQQQLLARQREKLGLEEIRALNAQDLLEHLPTAIVGIDADGDIAFVNRQARALMGEFQPTVGCPAEQALPAEWQAAWRHRDGRHRRVVLGGQPHLLSCSALSDRGNLRGHLLSIIPELEIAPATNP